MADYADGEALVSTYWVAGHLKDSKLCLVDVDVDTSVYD